MTGAEWSYLRISFDPTVSLHLSSFPPFNWSLYLAALGGSVGLWLGLGLMQLAQMAVKKFKVIYEHLSRGNVATEIVTLHHSEYSINVNDVPHETTEWFV